MDEQPHVSSNLALPRIHWTARVSCGFSVYTAVGFLVTMIGLLVLFSPALPVSRLWAASPLVGFLNLPNDLLGFLLMPLHPFLSPRMQVVLVFLQGILSYVIPFLFACMALRISGKPAWRKGRRLARISAILSGIVFGLAGALLVCVFLYFQLSFHAFF